MKKFISIVMAIAIAITMSVSALAVQLKYTIGATVLFVDETTVFVQDDSGRIWSINAFNTKHGERIDLDIYTNGTTAPDDDIAILNVRNEKIAPSKEIEKESIYYVTAVTTDSDGKYAFIKDSNGRVWFIPENDISLTNPIYVVSICDMGTVDPFDDIAIQAVKEI